MDRIASFNKSQLRELFNETSIKKHMQHVRLKLSLLSVHSGRKPPYYIMRLTVPLRVNCRYVIRAIITI